MNYIYYWVKKLLYVLYVKCIFIKSLFFFDENCVNEKGIFMGVFLNKVVRRRILIEEKWY